jgi:hypothetical protein
MTINIYAYTYEGAMRKRRRQGEMLVKIGDSTRDIEVRMREQGGTNEYESKITVGGWLGLRKIDRDHRVHEVLTQRGLHWRDGAGTEWFRIPTCRIDEARAYIDDVITDLEGQRMRKSVQLRALQQRALDQAIDIITSGSNAPSVIANLCPRFGKTIWALMLFNRISELYGNRIMLLPAYWLSVHTSFVRELDEFDDFLDIREVVVTEPDAAAVTDMYLKQGFRVVVPISLHGDLSTWSHSHAWLKKYRLDDIFMFADEGDFGTHTENQAAKLNFITER